MLPTFLTLLPFLTVASAWMPGVDKQILAQDGTDLFNTTSVSSIRKRTIPANKIRGVNLGSQFVFEPWIAESEWSATGCAGQQSEFDCVSAVGQAAANTNFQAHWARWITQDDINLMKSYSLNTIRVPVGYWMKEDLVYADSEHFPQGGFNALKRVCGMASDAGLYIILDMHGAPGAQVAQNSFTGQFAPTPGFYVDYQYDRATKFLGWLTTQVHSNTEFRNVGMLEVVNEPERSTSSAPGLVSTFYPNAFSAIRQAESAANVPASSALHIQVMNSAWGPGDPTTSLSADDRSVAAFDNHRYLKWDTSVSVDKNSYLSNSCSYNAVSSSDENPTIVGEFSISPPDNVQSTSDWATTDANLDFYRKWFAAQTKGYEKADGWVFWTWKAQLGDYRWSYKDAVAAGVIPANLNDIYNVDVC